LFSNNFGDKRIRIAIILNDLITSYTAYPAYTDSKNVSMALEIEKQSYANLASFNRKNQALSIGI